MTTETYKQKYLNIKTLYKRISKNKDNPITSIKAPQNATEKDKLNAKGKKKELLNYLKNKLTETKDNFTNYKNYILKNEKKYQEFILSTNFRSDMQKIEKDLYSIPTLYCDSENINYDNLRYYIAILNELTNIIDMNKDGIVCDDTCKKNYGGNLTEIHTLIMQQLTRIDMIHSSKIISEDLNTNLQNAKTTTIEKSYKYISELLISNYIEKKTLNRIVNCDMMRSYYEKVLDLESKNLITRKINKYPYYADIMKNTISEISEPIYTHPIKKIPLIGFNYDYDNFVKTNIASGTYDRNPFANIYYHNPENMTHTFRYGTQNGCEQKHLQHLHQHIQKTVSEKKTQPILYLSLLDSSIKPSSLRKSLFKSKTKEYETVMEEIKTYQNLNDTFYLNASYNGLIGRSVDKKVKKINQSSLSKLIEHITKSSLNTTGMVDFIEKYLQKNFTSSSTVQMRQVCMIFISLIQIHLNTFTLAYHCKSGQDRTGLFYITQQCVHQTYVNSNLQEEFNKLNSGKDILDFIQKHFNYLLNANKDKKCNKERKKQYCGSRPIDHHIYVSYLITFLSTGLGGIKTSLCSKKYGILVENPIPYLILPLYLLYISVGASKHRGS